MAAVFEVNDVIGKNEFINKAKFGKGEMVEERQPDHLHFHG